MIPKEALEMTQDFELWLNDTSFMLFKDTIQYKTLADLVAKAEPMKPKDIMYNSGLCPICYAITRKTDLFCYHCGQALDWSDEK